MYSNAERVYHVHRNLIKAEKPDLYAQTFEITVIVTLWRDNYPLTIRNKRLNPTPFLEA